MAELPLLIFPSPEKVRRTTRIVLPRSIHRPGIVKQDELITPRFEQLQNIIENKNISVQDGTLGIDPELALVIETVGSIDEFANAVKRIEGLEWLGEIDLEDIQPDEQFFDTEHPEKVLTGRLYFLMTNLTAINQLISLWRSYLENPQNKFPYGIGKLKDVFINIKDIRKWDKRDRLLDTGVIEIWREDLAISGEDDVNIEIELWYRESHEKREEVKNNIVQIAEKEHGLIIGESVIHDISYHSILCKLKRVTVESLISLKDVDILICDDIMFFRPTGQMVVGNYEGLLLDEDSDTENSSSEPLSDTEPIIALFDGLPLSQHNLLKDRLIIDDPDEWENNYPATDRVHGTGMASLIIHGDLNNNSSLEIPIYNRPIMKPKKNPTNGKNIEAVPDDILFVDLIHRAIIRLYEENIYNIKIINLSIGDPSRMFLNTLSPLARLLDWLSFKYSVLIVVSAGNHIEPIRVDCNLEQFKDLSDKQKEEKIISGIFRDIRNRRILSPAESINSLTVGALHDDSSEINLIADQFNPLKDSYPSLISAFGGGYRRSIKPDIIYSGGKQIYKFPLIPSDDLELEPVLNTRNGNKVASPGHNPGDLNFTTQLIGTSSAAAQITRSAFFCHQKLLSVFRENDIEIGEKFIVPILKALLVHGCSWSDLRENLSLIFEEKNSQQIKSLVTKWAGYGNPDLNRVLYCTNQRVTLIGYSELNDNQADLFTFPLPPSLSSKNIHRKLTISLGWLSPINPNNQKYRVASLWFEQVNSDFANSRKEYDHNAVKRGTLQHEIFEGSRANPFIEGDSLQIKVNCRKDAGNINQPIQYGLVASLEIAENIDIDIYNEISTQIRQAIQVTQLS